MCGIKKQLLGVVGRPELASCCYNWHVNIFALIIKGRSVNTKERILGREAFFLVSVEFKIK